MQAEAPVAFSCTADERTRHPGKRGTGTHHPVANLDNPNLSRLAGNQMTVITNANANEIDTWTWRLSLFVALVGLQSALTLPITGPVPNGKFGLQEKNNEDESSTVRLNSRFAWCVKEMWASIVATGAFIHYSTRATTQSPGDARFWTEQSSSLAVLSLFLFHTIYRAFIYPFRIAVKAERDYPLFPFFAGMFFNSVNGFNNGRYFGSGYAPLRDGWTSSAQFLLGCVVFFVGFAINYYHDGILISLRRTRTRNEGVQKSSSPTTSAYQIPRGGLFEYISAANYLGEIIEWFGYAMASNWSPPAVAFAVLTLFYLGSRGYGQHRFYLDKFKKSYPRTRKAVIPFLF